jgi:hypothetical protein
VRFGLSFILHNFEKTVQNGTKNADAIKICNQAGLVSDNSIG